MKSQVSFLTVAQDALQRFGDMIPHRDVINYRRDGICIPSSTFLRHKKPGNVYDLRAIIKELAEVQGITTDAASTMGAPSFVIGPPPEPKTDDQLLTEISSRFCALDMMANGVVNGQYRSLIVTGNPGIGKTYNLEYILEKAGDESKIIFNHVRGYVRATGLYRMLYDNREKDCVLLMDDADTIFTDETSLNMLKAALDTTHKREISWRSEKVFETPDGEEIPQSFQFNGSIIFVSNIDFATEMRRNKKLAPHLEALMSRSYYMDLHMRSTRELILHIKNVVAKTDILDQRCIETPADKAVIIDFIERNQRKMREISLRSLIKVGDLYRNCAGDLDTFEVMALATCAASSGGH